MARANLKKCYHDLNEKLITATNTFGDSAFEVNLIRNYEVGYLSSGIIPDEVVDRYQGHLLAIGTVLRYYLVSLLSFI